MAINTIGAAALVTVSGGSILMASLAAGAVSNGVSALSSFEKSGYDVDRFFKEQGADNVAEYLGMFATKTAITTVTIYAGTKIKDMGSKVIGKAKSKYKKHSNKEPSRAVERINAENLKYSDSAYHSDRVYQNSTLTMQEIIDSCPPGTDPKGSAGLWWKVDGAFNGSQGTFELLISPDKTTIWHFLFRGK